MPDVSSTAAEQVRLWVTWTCISIRYGTSSFRGRRPRPARQQRSDVAEDVEKFTHPLRANDNGLAPPCAAIKCTVARLASLGHKRLHWAATAASARASNKVRRGRTQKPRASASCLDHLARL